MASIKTYDRISKRTGKTERRWRVTYRDAQGRQVAKVFDRQGSAQALYNQHIHEKVTGTVLDTKAGRQTFGSLWDEVHGKRSYADATVALHVEVRKYLTAIENVPIADITPKLIGTVLSGIERPVMREKVRQTVGGMFAYAIANGRVGTNPARAQDKDRTRAARQRSAATPQRDAGVALSMADVARISAELPERYRALVRLMAHVGLRPGEAYALTVDKVDLLRGTVRIDTAVSGATKTGQSRTIPLPTVVVEILAEHLAHLALNGELSPDALVFTNEDGNVIQLGAFRHTFQRAAKRAGVTPVPSPNDLRHVAVAFAIASGADIYAVQRMVGHASPAITLNVYGYLFDDTGAQLATKLDAAIREAWDEVPAEATVTQIR